MSWVKEETWPFIAYFTGNANENYKVDLNVEASALVEDEEEDDVDWEEGWRGKDNLYPKYDTRWYYLSSIGRP